MVSSDVSVPRLDASSGSKRKRGVLQEDGFFLYEGGEVAKERRSDITRVRIGPHVKVISHRAFYGCMHLVEVQFDEGMLQVIEDGAFHGCTALKQVTIPRNVTKLSNYAFIGCTNLTQVRLNDGLRVIGFDAFKGCKALKHVTIPSSVTKLHNRAFQGCINLTDIHFNDELQHIGNGAFRGCKSLQHVTIPSSVTEMGPHAFENCTNMTEVHLNDGLEVIGSFVFDNCAALRSVTVPSSVTELDGYSFNHCTNLTEVILLGGEILINRKFLDRGLSSGVGALNKEKFHERVGFRNFLGCPLTVIKISIPRALSGRVERLPQEFRLSVEGRIRDMRRLELTQDGTILACFPLVMRDVMDEMDVEDTDNQTAESLHLVLRLISFYELKESSILIELGMWKSGFEGDRARADCRIPVPDPAKSLIMEYCGFTDFLKPAIEGT